MSMERITSPDQLSDYLRVTNPKIRMLLIAVAILVVGLIAWSSFAAIQSYAIGSATAKNGELVITFEDQQIAERVQAGMTTEVGGATTHIDAVGRDSQGQVFASAHVDIPDGTYDAQVGYKSTQVISLLFN